ncbi:hypothetical protein GMST_23240 [Geomonas silvestris]|uniref:MAP3K TRAFs-binding domain-containing protein n=1 Tax=Geomonas silvestris TaxID=2740184 RepID=A0A6V8MJX4_9BACT|nr:TRAFs-binding domain-containing protein [Geomonas silvestris]GFO59999.1 hypothetical protein GMST_23240 [Geomonas silvestris]
MDQPLCLIVMPFGRRKDATGRSVDFDAVYERLVVPAVRAAGLEPVRAEDARSGGVLQGHSYQRIMHCDYLVADLTTANASVYYQVGVRHAVRPHATVLILAAKSAQIPFDPDRLQGVRYRVSAQGLPEHEARYRALLTERLVASRQGPPDSPLFQTVPDHPALAGTPPADLRDNLQRSVELRQRLAQARCQGGEAVREVERQLGDLARCESGVVMELFLSYRAVNWWNEMIDLSKRMPPDLAATVLVQEQLGLALSRSGRGEEAENVLRDLIYRRGACSETYGILGRVLKDRWEAALNDGEKKGTKDLLDRAIDAYLKGFEADWRDAYPGVNAVTLMELKEPPDPRRREILPVVFYAVEQRIRSGAADYWDYSTLLELAVLGRDEAKGIDALGRTLAWVRAAWEPKTTARNLRLIREARQRREAEIPPWSERAEAELLKAAERGTARP